MPHGLRTLGKGFLKECLERGERMLLDRGDMLKQGKHSVGPFLTKYNVCALKLCLSNGYVTPRATPFAQTHPTPGGTLVVHLFGALAEFERSIIRERTRAGLAAARARGRTGGRPPALSAADKTAARALLKDPAIPAEAVAKRLQVSPATLYRHFPGGRSGLDEAGG